MVLHKGNAMLDEKWFERYKAMIEQRTGANNPRAKVVTAIAPDGTRYVGSIHTTSKHIGRCPENLRAILSGKNINATKYAIEYNGTVYPANQAKRYITAEQVVELIDDAGAVVYTGSSRGAAKFIGRSVNYVRMIVSGRLKNHSAYTVKANHKIYAKC
jgi:sulfur carrier protein ThiS